MLSSGLLSLTFLSNILQCSDPTCYDKNWEYVLERAIKRDPIEEKRAASRVILRALLELLNRDVQVRFSQIPYTRVPKDFLKVKYYESQVNILTIVLTRA